MSACLTRFGCRLTCVSHTCEPLPAVFGARDGLKDMWLLKSTRNRQSRGCPILYNRSFSGRRTSGDNFIRDLTRSKRSNITGDIVLPQIDAVRLLIAIAIFGIASRVLAIEDHLTVQVVFAHR